MNMEREKRWSPDDRGNMPGVLKVKGIPLHDRIDPQREAKAWVATQVGRDVNLVAVLGLGQGYHLEALRVMRPEADIVVWEPWPEIAAKFFACHQEGAGAAVEMDRVNIVNSLAELKSIIGQALVYGPSWKKCGLLIPDPYKTLAPDKAFELKSALSHLNLRKSTNLKTVEKYGSLFMSNFLSNFTDILKTPEAAAAIDTLKGLPALIVAAGPSLQNNLEEIKKARGKAVIISVGTVFKRLIKEGVTPDVVVMIEPRDRSAQVVGHPALKSVLLAVSSVGHPSHLKQESALNMIFHPQEWQSRLVGEWSHVPDGGNVASAAFTLGLLWGCNPIILAGQDLAYSLGKRYAKGAGNEGQAFDPSNLIRIPGNVEDFVYASPELISYLSWYEESAEYLKQARPGLELINATEGGAQIKGFTISNIKDVFFDSPVINPAGKQRLIDSLAKFKRNPDLIRLCLAELRREVALIRGMADDGSLSLVELENNIRTSPLGPHLAPLIQPKPGSLSRDKQIRESLQRHLDNLGDFAARLQVDARSSFC